MGRSWASANCLISSGSEVRMAPPPKLTETATTMASMVEATPLIPLRRLRRAATRATSSSTEKIASFLRTWFTGASRWSPKRVSARTIDGTTTRTPAFQEAWTAAWAFDSLLDTDHSPSLSRTNEGHGAGGPLATPPRTTEKTRARKLPPSPVLLSLPSRQRVRRDDARSEEHTSELQSRQYLVCRLL